MRFLNLDIVAHPLNWLTLAVWLVIFAVLAHSLRVLPDNVLDLSK